MTAFRVKHAVGFIVLVSMILSYWSVALPAVFAVGEPTCNGLSATIYVNGSDVIVGGPLDGLPYAGVLTGENGDDVIVGTEENDTITGGNGSDTICGLGGNDTINGDNDRDWIAGGDGNDTITGGNGNDFIDAGTGNNVVVAGHGDDFVQSGNGFDTIDGDQGEDTCLAGGSTLAPDVVVHCEHLSGGASSSSSSVGSGSSLSSASSSASSQSGDDDDDDDSSSSASVSSVGQCSADFDGNGEVNGLDVVVWALNFGTGSGATQSMGDADGDGDVDIADLFLWQDQFGQSTCTQSSASSSSTGGDDDDDDDDDDDSSSSSASSVSSAPSQCAADFNGDGTVDAGDFVIWSIHNGTTSGATRNQGDADGDGDVDQADYTLWAGSFGQAGCPTGSSSQSSVSSSSAASSAVSSTSSGSGTVCAADFNGDGTVDVADIVIWTLNNGTASGATKNMGDADGDGDVDIGDFFIWQGSFGQTGCAGVSSSAASSTVSSGASVSSNSSASAGSTASASSAAIEALAFGGEGASPENGSHRGAETTLLYNAFVDLLGFATNGLPPAGFGGGAFGPSTSYSLFMDGIPPPAFGGGDAFSSDQRDRICQVQGLITRHVDRGGAIEYMAALIRDFYGFDSALELLVRQALANAAFCEGLNEVRETKAGAVSQTAPPVRQVVLALDDDGVPISGNELWNQCLRGAPPLEASGKVFNCNYFRGVAGMWYHPDFPGQQVAFHWNARDPRGNILPETFTYVTLNGSLHGVELLLAAAEANRWL